MFSVVNSFYISFLTTTNYNNEKLKLKINNKIQKKEFPIVIQHMQNSSVLKAKQRHKVPQDCFQLISHAITLSYAH